MRPPARHAATCWVAAVRRNDQLEDISFCFMGSVHTVVYVRFPFPVLVLSFPKKRPPCRLNHPTEHPAFLFYLHTILRSTVFQPADRRAVLRHTPSNVILDGTTVRHCLAGSPSPRRWPIRPAATSLRRSRAPRPLRCSTRSERSTTRRQARHCSAIRQTTCKALRIVVRSCA